MDGFGAELRSANLSDIYRRDICVEYFGDGWIVSTCTPGNTLCCVQENETLPQCVQALNLGWCCTEDGGCYADLASACGQPGAVECSNLAANASRACCPQDTTCADNYNASEGWVRCNIERTNLQRLAASTSSMIGLATASSIASEAVSSASTSSTSSRSSPTSASTSASAVGPSNASSSSALATSPSQTSSPNPSQSSTLSGGVIAGIVIGSVLAMLLAVVCWFLWKRQKAARSNTTNTPYPPPSSTQFSDYYSPTIEPFEQAEKRGPSELTGGRDAQEVDGSAIQPVHGARSWMSKRSDQRIELE